MNTHDRPKVLSFTPRATWEAEHARHEERFARGLLYAVCLGVLAWIGIGYLVTRC